MDWNNDGKVDEKDAAFYYSVLNEQESTPSQGNSSSSGETGWVENLFCLIYLGLLLPGTIPINTFTMLIGLFCAGKLIISFLNS